jgi:hypothetical protein
MAPPEIATIDPSVRAASPGAGPISPTPVNSLTPGPASCTQAPAALVNTTLGLHVGEPEWAGARAGGACVYKDPDKPTPEVVIQFQRDATPESFTAGRASLREAGQQVTEVPGFRDEAYTTTVDDKTLLAARRGRVAVTVTSPAPTERARALAERLLAGSN